MEPYQEIVNIDEFFFFEGVATFKYCGEYHKYLSEKSGLDHYALNKYYDVEIRNIRQISITSLKRKPPVFQLGNIKNNQILAHYKKATYELDVDFLYVHREPKPIHSQIEDKEVLGEFVHIPVIFKMRRPATALRCIPNVPTGNVEYREDGVYHEYTTGELNEDLQTCETRWVKDEVCPVNEPTGNVDKKENCKRIEYYSGLKNDDGTCATYWGEWECEEPEEEEEEELIICVKDKPTGRKEHKDNCTRREYYTGTKLPDGTCETYWGEWNCRPGCFSIIQLLLLLGWIFFWCWLAVEYRSFIPIFIGIGLPLFGLLLGQFGSFFGWLLRRITSFVGWFLRLFMLLALLLMAKGMIDFFSTRSWDWQPPRVTENNWDTIDVTPIDKDTVPQLEEDVYTIRLKWMDYDKHKYTGRFELKKEDLLRSTKYLNSLDAYNYSTLSPIYKKLYQHDNSGLTDLYRMLDSIKLKDDLADFEFSNTIVSMVQSLPYALVLDDDCQSWEVRSNSELMNLMKDGTPCNGPYPFGIKTPIQFLTSMEGDCDTRTLLLYTLLKHYNYDVVIINSNYYRHSMLGLALPTATGVYKRYGDKKYYFWETTSKGFKLGELPRENRELKYWEIALK